MPHLHDGPRIGFIGLGIMGHPMAGHLAKAGYAMSAFDADPAAIERLRDVHPVVEAADSAAAVGAESDIVLTMLPDGEVVQQVALGPGRSGGDDEAGLVVARHVVGPAMAHAWPPPRRWRSAASA